LNGIIGLDNGQPDEDQCGREGNQRAPQRHWAIALTVAIHATRWSWRG